jgi:DNA-binding NarL/FixJ family response regulator
VLRHCCALDDSERRRRLVARHVQTGRTAESAMQWVDRSDEANARRVTPTAAGETLLQPVSTDPVRARFRFRDESTPTETFSPREVAILRLLAGGYSNKEIARSVFLAEGTVKNYVSDILAKLEARDRTQAVLKAITLKVI